MSTRQVAACSHGRDKGSPATVDKLVVHETTEAGGGGSGGSGSVVVPAAGASRDAKVKMDMRVLQCPLCTLTLKPPVVQCKGGHLACGGCPAEPCRRCEHGGAFDIRNTAMDAVVSAARVECPHDGCRACVAYHELGDHRGACPRAPCSCPEPGCSFAAPPRALLAHLFVRHSMPAHRFQYGKDFRLLVPASEPSRRLLIGGDDGRAFLLSAGALGAATAAWVVCVRAGAVPRPQYSCKMWSIMPPSQDIVVVKTKVTSSSSPGAVTAASFLTVPPRYYRAGPAGVSKLVPLNVRIDKI
uniref:SIAH-type domain-containing protein n=1 Tax=Hordeum vulgare subsp. vulgare TaxID=112509 RepID=A0A8I7B8X5_HORVV